VDGSREKTAAALSFSIVATPATCGISRRWRQETVRIRKDFQLELGGLTIIAGRNNTGKT